ncbi:ABC transporter substrate-binding protein [Pararhizobium haloflavum]|uniref:ABC transporter substrate-binding protein n=1 Tax=Pararhizobium haloflavum TaxID=2037914 RepID=UPI000C18182B|nr:ABC transporter substrate-binding protein [Pararhizobium haloflavum]
MTSISQNLVWAALFTLAPSAFAQEHPAREAGDRPLSCGDVSIAELNWASASIFSHIDAIILEHGYGCDVELIPGDTMSTLNSMIDEGKPDVSPETWINSARETLDQAVATRELHYMAPAFADGGVEGWWIPQYIAEAHPEIETVADALAAPELFPAPGDPRRGALHNCPEGWSCQISTTNLFEAYRGWEKGFDLLPSATGEALEESLAEAYADRKGWLGYYWAPTAALGRYDMVKLNFDAPYDEELWHGCIIDPDCAAPRITAWPRSEVYTVVTDGFARRANGALGYLKKRSLGNDVLNGLLAWMTDGKASGEEAAIHFLRTHPDTWREWVSEEAFGKVNADLERSAGKSR